MSAGGPVILSLLAAACGGSSTRWPDGAAGQYDAASTPIGSGTLVYSELDTYNIHLIDLATGRDALIDGGMFGSVAIAPDGSRVAYNGIDNLVKVADRARTIT